jgi:hypothetical protein
MLFKYGLAIWYQSSVNRVQCSLNKSLLLICIGLAQTQNFILFFPFAVSAPSMEVQCSTGFVYICQLERSSGNQATSYSYAVSEKFLKSLTWNA